MRKLLVLVVAVASVGASSAWGSEISIAQLFERYEDSGRSSLSMEEFGQRVSVGGEVRGITTGMDGNMIALVGAKGSDEVLARATFSEDLPASEVIARVKEGAPFSAVCTVGFTSGSEWMSLQDCVLE